MEHKEVGKIYGTIAPIFDFVDGNRDINSLHVNKIMKAMEEGCYIPPILVDRKTLKIIEGQHRYMAAQKLWKKGIPYILRYELVDSEDPLHEAYIFNNSQMRWNSPAFVKAKVAEGDKSYIAVNDFVELFPKYLKGKGNPRYVAAAVLIFKGIKGVSIKHGLPQLEETELTKAFEHAKQLMNQLVSVSEKLKDPTLFQKEIVLAWVRVASVCKFVSRPELFEEYINRIIVNPSIRPFTRNTEEWTTYFYNLCSEE